MIRTSEAVDEINGGLAYFHKDLPTVTKDSENPHFHNKFASLAANIAAADTRAAEAGLSVVQLMTYVDSQHGMFDALATRINHSSGQWMEAVQILHLPKEDPQGQGSAMTYGRRYNYQGAYGLAAEDDDAQSASDSVQKSGSTAASVGNSQPSGQKTKVGLIVKIAKDGGMTGPKLKTFVKDTIGHPNEDLNELTPEEQTIIVAALRAWEKEQKAVGQVQDAFPGAEPEYNDEPF